MEPPYLDCNINIFCQMSRMKSRALEVDVFSFSASIPSAYADAHKRIIRMLKRDRESWKIAIALRCCLLAQIRLILDVIAGLRELSR